MLVVFEASAVRIFNATYSLSISKPNCRAGSVPKFMNYQIFVVMEFVSDVRRMITPGTVAVHILEFVWIIELGPRVSSSMKKYDLSLICIG